MSSRMMRLLVVVSAFCFVCSGVLMAEEGKSFGHKMKFWKKDKQEQKVEAKKSKIEAKKAPKDVKKDAIEAEKEAKKKAKEAKKVAEKKAKEAKKAVQKV